MTKNSDIAVAERSFVVNYSCGGHTFLYSFDESRINDVLELVRQQADDQNFPLTDMDCLRLSSVFKLALAAMEPGGAIDASTQFARCEVFCVGAVAKKTSMPIAPTGPGELSELAKPAGTVGLPKSQTGNGCCHIVGGMVIGCLIGAFGVLCLVNIYVLFVCLFSLFAGR